MIFQIGTKGMQYSYLPSKIRGDDEILPLRGTRGHSLNHRINIGVSDSFLWVEV